MMKLYLGQILAFLLMIDFSESLDMPFYSFPMNLNVNNEIVDTPKSNESVCYAYHYYTIS